MLLKMGDVNKNEESSMKLSTVPSDQKHASALEAGRLVVRTILVAVDFSEASQAALEFATTLAKQLKAEMLLLHVFGGVPGELKILEAAYMDTSFREEAQKKLAEWQAQAASAVAPVKTVFREGKAVEREINEAARECKADLIVVGRQARESFFLKNTARKVLLQAPCPVLVGP